MIYSCITVLVLLAVCGGAQGKSGEDINKIIADLSESIAKSQVSNLLRWIGQICCPHYVDNSLIVLV